MTDKLVLLPPPPQTAERIFLYADTILRWQRHLKDCQSMVLNPRGHYYTRGMSRHEANRFIGNELADVIWEMSQKRGR